MRKAFEEYYLMSVGEKKKIWQDAIFVFDANILLNLYQYSSKTRKDFLKILEKIKDRIWIPHQFAFEYQRKRLKIIDDQANFYKHVSNQLNKGFESTEREIKKPQNQHPFLKIDKIWNDLLKAKKKAIKDIEMKEESHPNWFENDPIREELDKLFEGKVGAPCKNIEEIEKMGASRFAKATPPGFGDAKKPRPYGDWIGWYQILEMVKVQTEPKKPVIFITNDGKEDWWLKVNDKTVGPRPELVKEICDLGIKFHMYSMEQFMNIAEPVYKVDQKTIDEITEFSKKDAERSGPSSINTADQQLSTSGVEFGGPDKTNTDAGEQNI